MATYLINCNEDYSSIPCRSEIINLIKDIRNIIFPGYFTCCDDGIEKNVAKINKQIERNLLEQLKRSAIISHKDMDVENICASFMNSLPNIMNLLKTDLEATYLGDPAAEDYNEIIISYPGLFAISVYRIAHVLYNLGVPYIPRIMSEYAHSKTGIDIHSGADIGDYFFIDHGTGIVIGETSIIGSHVRIYQGVTIGALSLGRGQKLKGTKRHPTIGNNVTIYAGASILGGDTEIGDNVVIGSNTYILESVPANRIVRLSKVDMEITKRQ